MFLTFDKKSFHIRSDNGIVIFTKLVPGEVLTASLSGGVVTVTTKNGVWVYRQVGTSPVFNLFRRY